MPASSSPVNPSPVAIKRFPWMRRLLNIVLEYKELAMFWALHDNWHQINPYIVCNARFVTPQMLDFAANLIDAPMALFDIEHALQRRLEPSRANARHRATSSAHHWGLPSGRATRFRPGTSFNKFKVITPLACDSSRICA